MANGKDCKCGAHSFTECSCMDVDWRSEREVFLEEIVSKIKEATSCNDEDYIVEYILSLQEENIKRLETNCKQHAEKMLLIEAIKHMQHHLDRIAFHGNTLSQKRDIARKGLALPAEALKLFKENEQ